MLPSVGSKQKETMLLGIARCLLLSCQSLKRSLLVFQSRHNSYYVAFARFPLTTYPQTSIASSPRSHNAHRIEAERLSILNDWVRKRNAKINVTSRSLYDSVEWARIKMSYRVARKWAVLINCAGCLARSSGSKQSERAGGKQQFGWNCWLSHCLSKSCLFQIFSIYCGCVTTTWLIRHDFVTVAVLVLIRAPAEVTDDHKYL